MPDDAKQIKELEDNPFPFSALADQCLEAVSECAPVLRETLLRYGDTPLVEYLESLTTSRVPSLQSREDFLEIYRREVGLLLGEETGTQAADELDSWPMVLTANHLGVDYFSQSMQTNLLFYLLRRKTSKGPVVLPVIACGSVPLDNITYPLGVLLYRLQNGCTDSIPKKLPIFSNKVRRNLVSIAPPFNREMVGRAQKRLAKMIAGKEIDSQQGAALQKVFEEDYDAPGVMELANYSRQALHVNDRIWQKLFSQKKSQSHLVTMDMEHIVSQLLIKDLQNEESLIFSILMDIDLRKVVIEKLDGQRACWKLDELRHRIEFFKGDGSGKKMVSSCGTMFFWGITGRGRRVPLLLMDEGKSGWVLKGADDKGQETKVNFSSEEIIAAIKEGQILPSIFTSFTILAFARGLTCLGGYYQAEYLPMMQGAVVAALRESGRYQKEAELVERIETGAYLSGMQMVMTENTDDSLLPAGPVEIIAGGGLSDENLDRILSLTVRDAHLASLFETVDDISSSIDNRGQLKENIARYCWSLRDKVVVL